MLVSSPPFHGGDMGSNPVGVTIIIGCTQANIESVFVFYISNKVYKKIGAD